MVSIREEVTRALADFQTSDREDKAALRARHKPLEEKEAGLIDLAAEGQLQITKIRQCLDPMTLRKAAVAEKLTRTEDRMKFGADQVLAFVNLLKRRGELHERVHEGMQRSLLLASHSKLRVYVESDGLRIESGRPDIHATLHSCSVQQRVAAADHVVGKK